MADIVRSLVEATLPELEDLQKREIFSKAEIKLIAKKRSDFEYLLKRRQPSKEDFLKYIQYELDLNTLRKTRKKRLGLVKKSLSDYVAIRRIHFLFDRTLKRFPNDVSIWNQYFGFCKYVKSYKVLNRVFAKAIQKHPTNISFWIQASHWEFKQNQNITAARALFQRAIRLNSESKDMWIEYFKLEYKYLKLVKNRALGINKKPQNESESETEDLDQEETEEKPSEGSGTSIQVPLLEGEKTQEQQGQNLEILKTPFFTGAILKTIYKNAIKEFPRDIPFRLEFIKPLLKLEETKDLIDEIYNGITEDFWPSPECLKVLAAREIEKHGSNLTGAIAIFDKALNEDLQSKSKLNEIFIDFLNSSIKSSIDPIQVKTLKGKLIELFETGVKSNNLTDISYVQYIEFLMDQKSLQRAQTVCSQALSIYENSQLYTLYLDLAIQNKSQDQSVEEFAGKLFAQFRGKKIAQESQFKLLEYILSHSNFDYFLSQYKSLVANPTPPQSEYLENLLNFVYTKLGVDQTRKVYELTLKFPPISENYFKTCVTIEKSSEPLNVIKTRELFDQLTSKYGKTEHENWMDYLIFEQGQGGENVSKIYWRAKQALDNPTPFILAYHNYLNQ